MPNHGFEFTFHDRWHVGPGLEEVLEVRSGKGEHFARAVHAIEVVAVARFRYVRPVLEIGKFRFGMLCKQVVSESECQLASSVEVADHCVVVRIILEAAPSVNDTGQSEAI